MKNHIKDNFNEFNKSKHFLPKVKWDKIKDESGADFLWEVLEPISDMIGSFEHEEERVKRISPEQKALHFFWYLDGQVTNGGFIQFYWNGYGLYLQSIKKGLEIMEYVDLLKIVTESEKEYLKHIKKFEEWRKKEDWQWLYDNLKEFDKLDDKYYADGEKHYLVVEKFVRKNIDQFIIKK
jgi:hypothetical protein